MLLFRRTTLLLALAFVAIPLVAQQPADRKLSRSERKERVRNLGEKYRQFLADVEPIMQQQELDTFLLLESDAQRDLYITDFWHRRDLANGLTGNSYHDRYYDRLQIAKEKYRSMSSDRGRVFILHGEPREIIDSASCRLLQPIQVWEYDFIPDLGHNVRLLFFQPRSGVDYRLWQPMLHSQEALADLISSELVGLAGEQGAVAAAVQKVFGPCDPLDPRMRLTYLECHCTNGGDLLKAIGSGQVRKAELSQVFNPPQVNTEDVKKILHSVVIANPNAVKLPAEFSVAFSAGQGERTDARITILVPRSQLVLKEVAGVKLYSLDVTGEVLKGDDLFETYRYRFDYPSTVTSDRIAVVIDRFLRPAEYRSRIRVADINSNAEAVVETTIAVPGADGVPANGAPASASLSRSAGEDVPKLRLVPLRDEILAGTQHIDTITVSEVKAVEFYLDGKKVMTKRTAPFALELDLGGVPRMHRIGAVALSEKGEFIAGDELVVNAGNDPFRVRIVSPRVAVKLRGKARVEMDVAVPEDKKLEKLELFLNETRVATLYGPPYVQIVEVPANAGVGYLRAVATLADSIEPPVEDVVMFNTPQYMEQMTVHLIELPTTVLRDNRPVNDLPESAFQVLDEGKPVKISKFEHVTNLPLSIGLAIDTSSSMQPRIAEAQKAAAGFLSAVMKKGDKAFLLSFDSQPQIVQRWSPDVALMTAGLAKLRTDESTALYDAIVSSLYNFLNVKGQRALIVMTDGRDTSSKFSHDQALEYARRAGVPVYAIGIGISGTDVDVRYKLGKFAGETGGNAYFVDQASDLEKVYAVIQSELRSQYVLGFYPPDDAKPGSKWRNVTVQVDGGKAKTIRGYYP